MNARLLFILSAVGVLWLVPVFTARAQSIHQVQRTDQYIDFEVRNDSLKLGAILHYAIPFARRNQPFDILQQEVQSIHVDQDKSAPAQTFPPLIELVHHGLVRGRPNQSVKIHIARRTASENGHYVVTQLLRFRVYLEAPNQQRLAGIRAQSTLLPSPLAQGDWYKILIPHDGIFRINRAWLTAAGINPDQIDPRNIQVWGTGTYMLPQANAVARPEFRQIPVIVEGESDGRFDANDALLFFANGPTEVFYNAVQQRYEHQVHHYSTHNAVFLTIGTQTGLRLGSTVIASPADTTVTQIRDFLFKEEELFKADEQIRSGREWLGQLFTEASFSRTQEIFRDTIPGFIQGSSIDFQLVMAGKSGNNMTFTTSAVNRTLGQISIARITDLNSSTGVAARAQAQSATLTNVTLPNNVLSMNATFTVSGAGRGWLDWVRISLDRELTAENNRIRFFGPRSHQPSRVVEYRMKGFTSTPLVIDYTQPAQPRLLHVQAQGNEMVFFDMQVAHRKYFASSNFFNAPAATKIPNQNLRSIPNHPDYLIVTSEELLAEAHELAAYRAAQQGLRPAVVTQNQVFNDFSGGVPDVVAIRDFVRHYYLAANNDPELQPKYLLLFGDAHFDYKGNEPSRLKNHVFTFQSVESLSRLNSYGSDDFFGFMDDNEGTWINAELLDIGIGRLPVQTVEEARTMIAKLKKYDEDDPDADNRWRTIFTFAADDDLPDRDPDPSRNSDRDLHVLNADSTISVINLNATGVRPRKIYLFSYPQVVTPGGRRYPAATEDFINAFNQGSLVVNYSGHGNEQQLTDERLFNLDMTSRFTNLDKLTIFVTATCEFGRYDDNQSQSGAETVLLWRNGGAVATYTTTRVVFTGPDPNLNNFGLNRVLTTYMASRNELTGRARTLGEIYQLTKTTGFVGPSQNSRKFILLGDPASRIKLPDYSSTITSINGSTAIPAIIRTMRALDEVQISGEVRAVDGSAMPNFNGVANVQVLDARRFNQFPSRAWMSSSGCYMPGCGYFVQNDVLFSGRVTVANGTFTTRFIVPKDISYSNQLGRIIVNAIGTSGAASGSYSSIRFNGANPDAVDDGQGPEMDVFINDPGFVMGAMVNGTPRLMITLQDPSGINTTGLGVGHELTATLIHPNNREELFILNEFYQSELDDYTKGTIEFPFPSLQEGEYRVKVRAWDVFNNPSDSETRFSVSDSDKLTIREVYNVPNPMHRQTQFVIEHNQPGNPMDVSVRIYTLSGKPVARVEQEGIVTSSPFITIPWFARDDDGDRLATGTYLYVVRVRALTPKGRQTKEKIEKLVIIN